LPRTRKPVFEESPCVASAMRKASRRLTQLYDRAMEPLGLRSTQYTILSELKRRSKEPPTVAILAKALVMDRSSLGHNLRPLERDGYIALRETDKDRRRRHVVLTAKGITKHHKAEKHWAGAQKRFAEVFGKAEAAKLRAVLLGIARDERLT
jgi:DNA-binding MarR family transcriptional regulator